MVSGSVRWRSTRAISAAIIAISGSFIPCVVTDGVPMRTPLVTNGLRGSSGMVFLFKRDARLIEHRLGFLAGELGVERRQVDHHQVAVGAAADEPETLVRKRGRPARWR